MARGMVVGEKIVSQARTKEFEQGYDRIFGDRKPQRGRWIWDAALGKLVSAEDYREPERAADAPIMAGRFYENTCATDGTDIGSRRRHKAYMREHGLTTADDYRSTWDKAKERRETAREGRVPSRARREALERKMYELTKP